MKIDLPVYQTASPEMVFRSITNWQPKYLFWPKRCALSNRLMWMEKCLYGTDPLFPYSKQHADSPYVYAYVDASELAMFQMTQEHMNWTGVKM